MELTQILERIRAEVQAAAEDVPQLTGHVARLAGLARQAEEDAEAAGRDLARWVAQIAREGFGDTRIQLAAIRAQLRQLDAKVDHMTSQQDQLNADVAALSGAVATIQQAEQDNTAAVAAVQAELDVLKNQQPQLDLSGLEAAINGSADGTTPGLAQAAQSVSDGVAAVQGLAPAAPAGGGDQSAS